MTVVRPLSVVEVDPSAFTVPYDAALTDGLLAAQCEVTWATRPLRVGEIEEFRGGRIERYFYRGVDRNPLIPPLLRRTTKGLAHFFGLVRLVVTAFLRRVDVVHFQWAPIPVLDAIAIRTLRWHTTVVLTVHDTTPFNGDRFSRFQSGGFDELVRLVDHAIVHTRSAYATLIERGHDAARISIVPHGPLSLRVSARPASGPSDPRWTVVLFGQIKPYKGIEALVEACAALDPAHRAALRVIVAGEPQMDLKVIQDRIAEASLETTIEMRLHRHSEQEMADLFSEVDGFVFPYVQIDASGVYYLIKGQGKWIIASRVGIFAEDVIDGESGRLVAPGDIADLTAALADATTRRPAPALWSSDTSWEAIGRTTRALFERVIIARSQAEVR